MDEKIAKIALVWIDKWSGDKTPSIGEGVSESELDWDLPRKKPELCLSVIVHILSLIPADPSNRHFQVLAAGPLEDLIIENGEAIIEEVDTLARKSPQFRKLLNGTWLSRAKPEIRERLKKYLNDKW